MKLLQVLLLSCLILAACQPSKLPKTTTLENTMAKIHARFQSTVDSMYLAVPNTKGISMHVEAPDLNISWTGAIGWADSTTNRKLRPTDPALIASITKTYVAAAILKLVESGDLRLDESISELLASKTAQLLEEAGYGLEQITVAHLCSNTSGIMDYVSTEKYQNATLNDPNHVWTRNEQIALAMATPASKLPGSEFEYSETNFLLLTEILEEQTGQPFYASMRQLLGYAQHELKETWFVDLEATPEHLTPLVHQYAGEYQVESQTLHHSFDLFGGGGIAATPKDVALFTQLLFTGQLFNKPETKELLFHTVETTDGKENGYYMGIAKTELGRYEAYGHGGFWGTTTQYFPELNASVSIFLMERDEWPKYREMLQQVANVLNGLKTS